MQNSSRFFCSTKRRVNPMRHRDSRPSRLWPAHLPAYRYSSRQSAGDVIGLGVGRIVSAPNTDHPSLSQLTKHGDSANQERSPVSTLDGWPGILADSTPKPVSRPCGASLQFKSYADFGQHTEITLQDIPKYRLTLRLFVENEEKELQRKDNQTWALVQRACVICLLIACNP